MSSKILYLTDTIPRRSREKVSGNTVVGCSFELPGITMENVDVTYILHPKPSREGFDYTHLQK